MSRLQISPATHYREVYRSIASIPWLLFMLFFGLFLLLGLAHYLFETLAFLSLYVVAVRLAWRSMRIQNDGIDFPVLSPQDAKSDVGAFVVIFVVVPVVVLGSLVEGEGIHLGPGFSLGIALPLLLYSPLALVLLLRSNSVSGMFDVGRALKLVSADSRGYLFILVLVNVSMAILIGCRTLIDEATFPASIGAAILVTPVLSFCIPFCFGLCGLFVRQHARLLDINFDDLPVAVVARRPLAPDHVDVGAPTQPVSTGPAVVGPAVVGPAVVGLPVVGLPVVGQLLSGPTGTVPDMPVMTGQLLTESSSTTLEPAVPEPLDFDDEPTPPDPIPYGSMQTGEPLKD